jgi:hypothetical protein
VASAPFIQKLGIYDYFVDESSPVIFNGRLIMFESIVQNSPQWAGHWFPSFSNCPSYFRVRDQLTGTVLYNMTETCNHAFGSAIVDIVNGIDTMYVFGTTWGRNQLSDGSFEWSGACAQNNCSVDAYSTTDVDLQQWSSFPRVVVTNSSLYNTDVTKVTNYNPASGLPPHKWVMASEPGGSGRFFVSNLADPTDATGWIYLDQGNYTLDQFGNSQIGSCPSIRFDDATSTYYVMTGGFQIILLRSKTLLKGSWELAKNNGVLINPDDYDCILETSPYGSWFNASIYPAAVNHINTCLDNSTTAGFGNDSDIDLTEIQVNGQTYTLFQYGSGDQASFGVSNLALATSPMIPLLNSYFN